MDDESIAKNILYYPRDALVGERRGGISPFLVKADIHALGIMMLEAFTGTYSDVRSLPEPLEKLVTSMIRPNYAERPTYREIIDSLTSLLEGRGVSLIPTPGETAWMTEVKGVSWVREVGDLLIVVSRSLISAHREIL